MRNLALLFVLLVVACHADTVNTFNNGIKSSAGAACRDKVQGDTCIGSKALKSIEKTGKALMEGSKGICVSAKLKNGTSALCCTVDSWCKGKGKGKAINAVAQVAKIHQGKTGQRLKPGGKKPTMKKGGRTLLQKVRAKPAHLINRRPRKKSGKQPRKMRNQAAKAAIISVP